ncbi:MAG: PAS domain-containing protein [Deltaproteobacteria bacterium]|uniref:PAS domain S-box protein n=1 Tax=Desulfobacula sp. TaxID=2593537 RepID=UPI00198BFB84|nr:PAS domain-containing protein [Candidatus Desulfobacula maris]MBL6994282.1 PAS domain-containing protein [Desulfobacula sp.]
MALTYDEVFGKKKKTIDERIGDSMLAFAIGLAFFFWFFSVLIRFLDSPDLSLRLLFIGTELQFYEKLFGSTLFIVFGSHVSSSIKKQRQAEKNFKIIQKKHHIILESIEEGYYEIDFSGEFKFINKSMCTLLARNEKEIIGTNIISYLDDKYIPHFNTLFNKIKNNVGRSGKIKCKLKLKEGVRKDVEISVSQILDTDLKSDGVSGIIKDIS